MKKVLMGTSAIALAGAFATTANAASWDVRVGGYMESYAAYATSDVDGISGEDFDGIDQKNESEVHFLPSITLDNGIQLGANIELEAHSGSDQIDESYFWAKGSFGKIEMGDENSARYKMQVSAPDVTFTGVNSGDLTFFMPYSGFAAGDTNSDGIVGVGEGVFTGNQVFRGTLGSTFIENKTNNDAQRFSYYTPRFAGFQVGASYARDDQQDNNSQLNLDDYGGISDIFDIGVNYTNSFGAFNVALAGGYGWANEQGSNPEVWNAGINLGYGGFTIGGSYADQSDAEHMDGHAWDAGVSYETGPWGFSFTYLRGENKDDENYALGNTGSDEQLEQYLLGVTYDLAQGVTLQGFGAYVDFEEDDGDAGAGSPGNDVDGWVLGTAIKLSW